SESGAAGALRPRPKDVSRPGAARPGQQASAVRRRRVGTVGKPGREGPRECGWGGSAGRGCFAPDTIRSSRPLSGSSPGWRAAAFLRPRSPADRSLERGGNMTPPASPGNGDRPRPTPVDLAGLPVTVEGREDNTIRPRKRLGTAAPATAPNESLPG